MPYLMEDDILTFASTCKLMRTITYSPMALKVLLCARSRAMAEYFQSQILDKVSMNKRQKETDINLLAGNASKESLEALQAVLITPLILVGNRKQSRRSSC